MAGKAKYSTRQRREMRDFLESTAGGHFTAADVCAYFSERQTPIGTSTVYRQLEELVGAGQVKKYFIDEGSSACFEYISDGGSVCSGAYHMKCEKCGRIIHLQCEEITELEEHISKHHGFRVDPMRTVFYGICESCQ